MAIKSTKGRIESGGKTKNRFWRLIGGSLVNDGSKSLIAETVF